MREKCDCPKRRTKASMETKSRCSKLVKKATSRSCDRWVAESSGMANTGERLLSRTSAVTLPMRSVSLRLLPRVPITTSMGFSLSVYDSMTSSGMPSTILYRTLEAN